MTAKQDCEKLMNAVLPLAEQMLREYGEFHPYGGVMKYNDELCDIAGYDGTDDATSSDIIQLLEAGLIAAAQKKEYKATAIVYDTAVELKDGLKSSAIAIRLDHVDHYSVLVLFPYEIDNSQLFIKPAIATSGAAKIFGGIS